MSTSVSVRLAKSSARDLVKYQDVITACDKAGISYPDEVNDLLDGNDTVDGQDFVVYPAFTDGSLPKWLVITQQDEQLRATIDIEALPNATRSVVIEMDS